MSVVMCVVTNHGENWAGTLFRADSFVLFVMSVVMCIVTFPCFSLFCSVRRDVAVRVTRFGHVSVQMGAQIQQAGGVFADVKSCACVFLSLSSGLRIRMLLRCMFSVIWESPFASDF